MKAPKLSPLMQGILFIIAGFILLVSPLGVFRLALNLVLVITGLGLVWYGLMVSGIYDRMQRMFKKKN